MTYHRSNSSIANPEPSFRGYQLIGDSQFLRFAEQLLDKHRKKSDGLAYLGLCVSGQKIGELLKRVRENFYPTSRKAIVMIGTNDLLHGTSAENMRSSLKSLLSELSDKGATEIILLTVPPVPRLANSTDHWRRLKEYNDYIRTRHNGKEIIVINAYAKFVKSNSSDQRSSISSLDSSSSSRQHGSSCLVFANGLETPKLKCNIRVSIEPEGPVCSERTVYVLPSDSDESPRNSPEENRFLNQRMKRRANLSIGNDRDECDSEPPAKRRVYSVGSDVSENRFSKHSTQATKRRTYSTFDDVHDNKDEYSVPPLKRRAYSFPDSARESRNNESPKFLNKRRSYSITDDDHDDRFGENDSYSSLTGLIDDIRMDYFEEFFSRKQNRKDLIHFNYEGLRVIKHLLLNVIDR